MPEDLKFIAYVNAEIALDNYERAVELFMEGIKDLIVSNTEITEEQFVYHVSRPTAGLIRHKLRERSVATQGETAVKVEESPSCSFCGKYETQVAQLIGGPGVFICGGCVETCNKILDPKADRSG